MAYLPSNGVFKLLDRLVAFISSRQAHANAYGKKTNTPFFHPKSHLSIKSCIQNVYRIKHTGAFFRQMDTFFPVTVVVFNNFSFLHIVCDGGDGG